MRRDEVATASSRRRGRGRHGLGENGVTLDVVPDPSPHGEPLVALAERLDTLARDRLSSAPVADEAMRRAHQLADHVRGHVLPRARSLDAPLLVLLVGPTGAGKSSLLNGLAGRAASRAGVLRPTTRDLVVLVRPEDRPALLADGSPLAAVGAGRAQVVDDASAPAGVALVDAPDVDSVEHANRELTDRLTEAADLGVFVTTATRYADRVPWDVLERIRDRGLPLVVVVNRMPADPDDRTTILGDVRRLLAESAIHPAEIIAVDEGAVDPSVDGLQAASIGPLRDRLAALGSDHGARRALAARALAGSLAGLGPLLERVADDAEHEAIEADALRRVVGHAFGSELSTLHEDVGRGTFLRTEALRQWQEFVGADQITRLFSTGIGRLRGSIATFLTGMPRAPVAEVRDEAIGDLVALAHSHVGEAIRRTASAWSEEPATRDAIASDPGLWAPSASFGERLAIRLDDWIDGIGADVRATGGQKRVLARGASIGVNATGIGVMLATFAHTGGLTGAEVGITAATGFLNQKLLEALFGEAAMVEMVARARARLGEALEAAFANERERFDALVPDGSGRRALAAALRAVARDVAGLRA